MKTSRLSRVQVSGIGLVTTLGDSLEHNLCGLQNDPSGRGRRTLNTSGGPVDVPYLALDPAMGRAPFTPVAHAVEQALASAGMSAAERCHCPVFIGSSSYAIGQSEMLYADALAGGADNPLAVPLPGFGQLSRYLRAEQDLQGADFLFNTACTASANALLVAAEHIACGRGDHALVIGMELANTTTLAGFYGMQLLANEVMRPFDLRRDGLVLGEGCGVIALRAASAGESGIFFAGGASSCDTYSISTSNPDGSQIAATMREALANVGIAPDDIAAIKAHGTASPLNDNAEAAGMHQVFAHVPPFFALKSHLGHTLGACGAIETAISAGSLLAGTLPPTGGFEQYDEQLGVSPQTSAFPTGAGHYMLNFFGFGGNNASIILESVRCDD